MENFGEEFESKTGNFLKDPLSLHDLIETGCNFEISTNFDEDAAHKIFDELNLGSDEEDDNDNRRSSDELRDLVSPWLQPFAELKENMLQINPYLWKKVTKVGKESEPVVPFRNARVSLRYNAYWEGQGAPFDSSFLRGSSLTFYTGLGEVLEGLEAAVCTMHSGEHSQFVISYHLLFREMGCPPRIKPKADALFIIELLSYNLVGDIDADLQISPEDKTKFPVVIGKVKDIHLKGLDFFRQGLYRNASRAFEKAAEMLKFCRLANEEEEEEQKNFLIKLFTNLAVCYIKVNLPSRTCIVCKEIRQLTNNKPSCKALFQEGRALLMLGEYKRARELLVKAQYMEPHNNDIGNELKILDTRYSRYKENERSIWTKAMGIIKSKDDDQDTLKKDDNLNELEEEMLKLLQNFKDDESQNKLCFPAGFTSKEVDIIDNLAKRLELKLSLDPLHNGRYSVNKKKV
uniref:peptidylprolyl isomerase n=1 Tax=Glossina morsitans morsitans TaxID=37546 RepID=A0A1B0G7Q4_GLOMM